MIYPSSVLQPNRIKANWKFSGFLCNPAVNRDSDSREIHWHNDEFHQVYAKFNSIEIFKVRNFFLCIFLFETNIYLEFIATFFVSFSVRNVRFALERALEIMKGAKFALIFLDCVPNPRPRNRSQFANNLHESPGNSTAEWLDRSIMKHGAGKGGEEKKGASCQFHA